MKVITWNCNMAFRKKWKAILDLQPDILVLQECEKESKYRPEEIVPGYNQFIWIGDNPNKGVGILSFNDYHIQISKNYVQTFKYIIPIAVTGAKQFTLFAIWAMPNTTKRAKSYVGQIWGAVHYYKSYFKSNTILIGDWNSNARWDNERRSGNHSDVVAFLNKYRIKSIYHTLKEEQHGKEAEPTLYLLKKTEKPFHLDYCFASENMITSKTTITVGTLKEWIKISDHMPLIIDHLG